MDEIWTVLEGIDYPVSKDALVATATGVGARDDLLHRLSLLPEKTFGDAEQLGRALSRTRAASNPALVAITAEPCPDCGFPMPHGQPHSCIEEKARFAESVHAVTDDFETLDEGREPPA